jgi:excisionase family DNA binding protein
MPVSEDSLPPTQQYPCLAVGQVAERLGVSEATIYRMIARGEAPPSFRIGRKRRVWRETDVLAWLETECRAS